MTPSLLQRFKSFVAYLDPKYSASFWHGTHPSVKYDYPLLSDYYLDFTCRTRPVHYSSRDGIPLLRYPFHPTPQYNPCAVAQWGLGHWQLYQRSLLYNTSGSNLPSQNSLHLHNVLAAANSLLHSFSFVSDEYGFWTYSFDLPAYGQKAPWKSAIAQGQAISFLIRALPLTSDQARCFAVIKAAYSGLMRDTKNGGLRLIRQRLAFLEEIVSNPPSVILDGAIYATFGALDYCYLLQKDPMANPDIGILLNSIARVLRLYDLKYWSRADVLPRKILMPSSYYYHMVHVNQLNALADVTGYSLYESYANKWRQYSESPVNRLFAFLAKVAFKAVYY